MIDNFYPLSDSSGGEELECLDRCSLVVGSEGREFSGVWKMTSVLLLVGIEHRVC